MKKYKTTIMAFYEAFNYFVSASIISLRLKCIGVLITIQHACLPEMGNKVNVYSSSVKVKIGFLGFFSRLFCICQFIG